MKIKLDMNDTTRIRTFNQLVPQNALETIISHFESSYFFAIFLMCVTMPLGLMPKRGRASMQAGVQAAGHANIQDGMRVAR